MNAILHGVRYLDFSDDKGRNVQGTNLFLSLPMNGTDCYGNETVKVFLNKENTPKRIEDYVGTEIGIDFNQKGKVSSITV